MKTYKEFLTEKVFRLTGVNNTKTKLGGRLLQGFKKNIEKLKYTDDKETLAALNMAWKKYSSTWASALQVEIFKIIKKEDVISITVNINDNWEKTSVPNKNIFKFSKFDYVINIEVPDDVNAEKYTKRLGGWVNPALRGKGVTIFGKRDGKLQNIEITDNLILEVNEK